MQSLAVLMLAGITTASGQLRLPEPAEVIAAPTAGEEFTELPPPAATTGETTHVILAPANASAATANELRLADELRAADQLRRDADEPPGIVRLTSPAPTPIALADEPAGMVRMSSRPDMVNSGFFFLSTHRSPQTARDGLRFCPVVSRYDNCGPFRGSSFDELRSQIVPGIPVCIYVHGSFVDMASACKESVETWRWLKNAGCGQQMQMIYVYWPSYKPLRLTVQCDVNQLGRQAARNGFYLADLINCLPADCPICLMGHSHGTRVIASGLHLLSGGSVQGRQHLSARTNGRRIRAVFVASALDHDWLNPGHKYDRALCGVECLLNMKNSRDKALKVYPLRLPLIARRAAGQYGFSNKDRYRMGYNGCKIYEYDATDVVGREHLWPYYFSSPRLGMVVRNYVYFSDASASAATSHTITRGTQPLIISEQPDLVTHQ